MKKFQLFYLDPNAKRKQGTEPIFASAVFECQSNYAALKLKAKEITEDKNVNSVFRFLTHEHKVKHITD